MTKATPFAGVATRWFSQRLARLVAEPPPDLVVEISERAIVAVAPQHPADSRREVLSEQAVIASPSSPNLLLPQLCTERLRKASRIEASDQAGNTKLRAALVLPDYAARVALLDFEDFPEQENERISLLRLRLRKSVPFPVDEAQLAYDIQGSAPGRVEVLTVLLAHPILTEYENLVSDLGYRLGLVTTSSLAALRLCDCADAGFTLVAKLAGATLSILLVEQQRVRLVRSVRLDSNDSQVEGERENGIVLALRQTLAFAEDEWQQPVTRLVLCGFDTAGEERVGRTLQLTLYRMRSRFGEPDESNAGLLGLLEQYAA